MRLIVFMLISVFVIITIKLGWSVKDLKEFKIDESWKYIIGIALGSKAVQSFSENMDKVKGKKITGDNMLEPLDDENFTDPDNPNVSDPKMK